MKLLVAVVEFSAPSLPLPPQELQHQVAVNPLYHKKPLSLQTSSKRVAPTTLLQTLQAPAAWPLLC
jgi:hypothetical protein